MYVIDCFKVGKKGGRRPIYRGIKFTEMRTALECQEKCQSIFFCEAFVFNENAHPPSCNLKKYDIGRDKPRIAIGKTFGPKYCPGNITIYVCIIM